MKGQKVTAENLELALQGAVKMEEYIKTARKQIQNQTSITKFSLNKEIENLTQLFRYRLQKSEIKLKVDHQKIVSINGDVIKLHQALTNILSNAIDAYTGSRKKKKVIEITINKNKTHAEVHIRDFGSGISPVIQERIFEPLFTTKRANHGMGMGLFITKRIIELSFQGTIKVSSSKKDGTVFMILIPFKSQLKK